MSKFQSFQILTSGNPVLIILGILALAGFAYFIYKYTIPQVSRSLKVSLIIIRSLILIFLLLLIFEPLILISNKFTRETRTYVFVDNSISIAVKDSSSRHKSINSLLEKLEALGSIRTKLFSFGEKIDSLDEFNSGEINFKEKKTNFAQIINLIQKQSANINSAVVVSDGIMTDGVDPSYQAEKLQVPLFTVGVGDSTEKKDVSIQSVLYNRFIYADKPTTIEVAIKNSGYQGSNSHVSFYEEDKLIESKDIALSDLGFNKIVFNYKPSSSGEKKLRIIISSLPDESNNANNSKTFYINVLKSKVKVCLVAGSPSEDVSSISDALSADQNVVVYKLIQLSSSKFWNDAKPALVDSSDILFLVDFPAASTPPEILDKISTAINEHHKPFFILVTNRINFTKLRTIDKTLPFSIGNISSGTIQVQPELIPDDYSLNFSNDNNNPNIWNNLPPVLQVNGQFPIKIGTSVLVQSMSRNVPINNPLIIARSLGNNRSFAILAGDIWRWQLQTAEKNPQFFINFIDDIVKWLNVSSKKRQFIITTDKKLYSPGEQINFTAELYDKTFEPIDTSKIDAEVLSNQKTYNLVFTPIGNGIYSSSLTPSESGDYSFYGSATIDGMKIKSDTERFSIGEIEIEKLDTQMKPKFLQTLAKAANGEYYNIDNYSALLKKLSDINSIPTKEIITKKEYRLWSNVPILLIIIFLFGLEWFIRKRAGML